MGRGGMVHGKPLDSRIAHWDPEPGSGRRAAPSAPRSAAHGFRPLSRGRGHRSAMSSTAVRFMERSRGAFRELEIEIVDCPSLPALLHQRPMESPNRPGPDIHSEVFLRRLMRDQLRLSIFCAGTFLLALFGLPLLNYFFPELMATRVFGFTLTWFVLGVLFFPLVWVIAYLFIQRSIALEEAEVAEAKPQIPNPTSQTNSKSQPPNGGRGSTLLLLGFGAWSFLGFWGLGFGI
jgi:uncharacterized membrane protein (DUF485 family)